MNLPFLRLLVCVVLLAPGLALAQDGSIRGTVTHALTGESLPAANVYIQELQQGDATDTDGVYTITAVAPGQYTLVASFISFKRFEQPVTVRAGQETVVNIQLEEDFIGVEVVVVTGQGTGIAKRRLSTTVEVITSEQLEASPSNRLDEILQGRLPGAQIRFSSGQPGTASQIRSRGPVSASTSTTPVIYIDGVRVDNLNTGSALSLTTGGAQSSAFPDIPIENIERIEFIKGGAATTLYGSDAANGVIQIFTKKGVAGQSTFTFGSQLGFIRGTEDFLRFDETADIVFDPGFTQEYRLSGSGGTEDFSYSFAGSAHDDNGFRLNNENTRYSLRSTIGARVSPITRYIGSLGVTSNRYDRDYNANTSFSTFGNLEGGNSGDLSKMAPDELETLTQDSRTTIGLVDIEGDTKRFQTSQQLEFTPFTGFTAKATVGVDYRVSVEQETESPAFNEQIGNDPTLSDINRVERRFLGLTLEGTAQYQFDAGDFSFVSTAGGQVFRDEDDQLFVSASNIAQGSTSINNAAEQTATDFELTVANYGIYALENIGFKNRYFIEGGLRVDANSAFGDDVGVIVYPKIGASYVLSSEPFFEFVPTSVVSNLKFRVNLGFAGNFPTPFANDRLVTASAFEGEIAFAPGQVGNIDLEPERTRTFEVGGDIGFWNDRIGLEVTYYDARTEDALFNVPFTSSSGQPLAQLFNVGEVENKGWEFAAQINPINSSKVDLRLNASLNTLDNEVTDNGGTSPFVVGGFSFLGQFVDEGKPLGFLRGAKPTFDEEGNFVSTERNAELGSPLPDAFGSLGLSLTLWNRLSLSATADYQLGAQGIAVDDVLRFFNGVQDDDRFPKAPDGSTPALGQAGFFDLAGVWVEDTDFLKVRLISLRYTLPEKWYQNPLIKRIKVGFRVLNPFNFHESSFDPEITGDNGLNNRQNLTVQSGLNLGVFGFGTESPPRQFVFDLKIDF